MKKVLVAAGCIVFSVMSASKAVAADLDFSQFFVFGDSLSDTGNTSAATGGTIPVPKTTLEQPAYFQGLPSQGSLSQGRFSNGPIWVDYLSQEIGKQPTPFLLSSLGTQGGVNYASGGAQTGEKSRFPGLAGDIPGVLGQAILFSQQTNVPVDSNGIYSIFGGSNDYFFGNRNVSEVVKNLTDSIGLLAQKNAKNFLVFNLPDIGETPFAKRQGVAATQVLNGLVQEHNKQLALAVDNLRSVNPQLNIYSVDINTLFRSASSNPAAFGLTNVSDACITGNFQLATNVCDEPDKFLFFDDVHPSSAAHRFIADAALASIRSGNKSIPEPSMGLGLLTLASLGAVRVVKRKNKKLVLK
ncbi:GDSL family lipase [Calothrix sp. NIES-4071]|nr:GDSL family lipase [Calothrix sp. NIES-4071]BAZ62825.1 GDSL family lipase [Calothrix sp. NIES-4105]